MKSEMLVMNITACNTSNPVCLGLTTLLMCIGVFLILVGFGVLYYLAERGVR